MNMNVDKRSTLRDAVIIILHGTFVDFLLLLTVLV